MQKNEFLLLIVLMLVWLFRYLQNEVAVIIPYFLYCKLWLVLKFEGLVVFLFFYHRWISNND